MSEPENNSKGAACKALVVDDDDSIRTMVSRILQRQKFHVTTARDGLDAIDRLKEDDFGVIVLDLMMPRLGGAGVVEYMKAHCPEKLGNIIVMTAFGAPAIKTVCPPVGRFLSKPFDIHELTRQASECSARADEVA